MLAALSAAITLLAFPPFNIPLALPFSIGLFIYRFLTLAPVSFKSFSHWVHSLFPYLKLGLIFGCVFMLGFHAWMLELTPFGPLWGIVLLWIGLSLYLSLFYAIMTAILAHSANVLPIWIAAPSIWIVCEWLRSLGPLGDSGGILGYGLSHSPSLSQWAFYVGVYGVSFIVVLISTLSADAIHRFGYRLPIRHLLVISVSILLPFSIGSLHYHWMSKMTSLSAHRVAVIQGNHPQSIKLNPSFTSHIQNDYLQLSSDAISTYRPDIIFWPETVTPRLNLHGRYFTQSLSDLATNGKTAILFGTPIRDSHQFYNAVAGVDASGHWIKPYVKTQLMPFGEYWPLRSVFTMLGLDRLLPGSDYTSGSHQAHPTIVNGIRIGHGICLEATYPWIFRRHVKNGADILAVYANNAWFFSSSAADKLFQMSQYRAIETHRYVVQASNTGISGIISPQGEVVHATSLDERRILSGIVYTNLQTSVYTIIGDSIVWMAIGIILFSLIKLIFHGINFRVAFISKIKG